MQPAFTEPCKANPGCELRVGIASWDTGDRTAKSAKFTWFDKTGKAARGGEIPIEALPELVTFAIRTGYLTLAQATEDKQKEKEKKASKHTIASKRER